MIRFLYAVCMISLAAGSAGAETYRLSLRDAIESAGSKNGRVRAAGFNAEAARQGISIATSRYFPSVTFEEAFTISDSPTQTFMMKLDEGRFTQNDFLINNLNNPGTQHDFKTALILRQPIYNPSIAPAREIAVKESQIQDTRLDGIRQETAFRTFRLYLDIQKAQARLQAAEQAVTDAREHLRLAVVRNQNGVGLRSDELRARTHLSVNEQQLISARNNLAIARLGLASVIGLKEGDSVEITDTRIAAVPLPQSAEELLALSSENRNELKLSQAEYEKADALLSLARSSYLPSSRRLRLLPDELKGHPLRERQRFLECRGGPVLAALRRFQALP